MYPEAPAPRTRTTTRTPPRIFAVFRTKLNKVRTVYDTAGGPGAPSFDGPGCNLLCRLPLCLSSVLGGYPPKGDGGTG